MGLFTIIQDDKKKIFLIKNAAYFNENSFSQAILPHKKCKSHRRTYLHELSKINQGIPSTSTPENQQIYEQGEQLSLFVPIEQVSDELQ
ncbi:hypothetical protein M948_08055 [Virgibacillus sp. CM-4]|nr:hypothetical protein M948_08055 [Virgibacillus sp. CM-4]